MKKLVDRRSHKRVPVNRLCWFEGEEVTLYGRITNASLKGAFIRTAAPLKKGEIARLIYTDEAGEQTVIDAEVVWVNGGDSAGEPGCGLRLLISEGVVEQWRAFLSRVSESKK